MIGVKTVGGNGSSEQNNIDIVKYFYTGSVSTSRMVDTISSILAYMPPLEIDETQSFWFNFLFSDAVTVRYKMVKKGKGIYGNGGIPIEFTDLHFISSTVTTASDFEENPTTAKYYVEDLGGLSISDFVNDKFLGYEIKDKELGETIFKVGIEPDYVTHWFVGDAGTYGEGLLQSEDSDFELLSENQESITKVSQLENDSNFIAEVSVQNGNGFEQFKTKDLMFDGFSFDPANKKIRADALVPLSAYLDVVNGSDINGVLQNANRPFKTIAALFTALPATTGETYTIYMTGGTVPVTRRIPPRNINWVAYTATTLDFTGCMENDGFTHAVNVQSNSGSVLYNYNFENANISIINNYNGSKSFSYIGYASAIFITGTIDALNWKSVGAVGGEGFCLGQKSNFKILNAYDSPQNTSLMGGVFDAGKVSVVIENYNTAYGRSLENGGKRINTTINNILKVGTNNFTIHLYGFKLEIGNITLPGCTVFPFADMVRFFGTISPTCLIDLSGTRYISGTVASTTYLQNQYMSGNVTQVFEDFTGKVRNLKHAGAGNAKVLFKNVDITTDRVLLNKSYDSNIDIITFEGFNTITQLETSYDLFETDANSVNKTIEVNIKGNVKTNALSFGTYVKSIYPSATFKEKLKEITVRSKKDLVNRVLDSNLNYIIDGVINDITSADRIIVPVDGLSLSGYGFDVSVLKALQPNSLLFSSPAGGSGNLFLSNISLEASGGNSKVFSVTNAGAATGGADAIELNVVNFDNCDSLGNITNFRQGLWDNIGMFGCKDGLTFNGVMSGGFRAESVIVRNFGIAGTASTIFKKGIDLLFKSRLLTDINADFKENGSLSDFGVVNFGAPKLYQIKAAQITRNGVLDDTQNYTGEITAFSNVSDWSGNNGLPNSKEHPYGIKTDRMKVCVDDAEASEKDIEIGEVYVHSATGYFKTRLI